MLVSDQQILPAEPLSEEPAQRTLILRVESSSLVAQHTKVEFSLQGPAHYRNPYDPDEVEVSIEVTPPAGRSWRYPAFFHQSYEYRQVPRGDRGGEWFYPAGPPTWRARYTPVDPGPHQVVASLVDALGTIRSDRLSFDCVAKPSPGFIRVSKSDPRFFEFEDGTPFFPLGQNVAFIGASQYLDTRRAAEVFRKMSAEGANFARVWACAEDWGLAIEGRKSAWGRSWDWRPPIAAVPGRAGYHTAWPCIRLGGGAGTPQRVSPSHAVALRPGAAYQLSGEVQMDSGTSLTVRVGGRPVGDPCRGEGMETWTRFTSSFAASSNEWWLGELTLEVAGPGPVWLRELSLREAAGGAELLWEADPGRAPRGFYNQPDSVMLDRLMDAAETNSIYVQLCLLTRDHYRWALGDPGDSAYAQAIRDAKKLFRYAVARWGYSRNLFAWEYFNEMDPNAPTDLFYAAVGDYLQEIDLYHHLRTTSGWGPAPRSWVHRQLDMADLHWYLRPAWGALWQDEVAAILDRAALLRRAAPAKPALLGEFGLATDSWGRSPYMEQDKENVHFHNSLWASVMSGLSGAASFWWWETLDQNDAYPQYRPLAAFLAKMPWTTGDWQALTRATDGARARVLALRGKDGARCWIFNPEATWWRWVAKETPRLVKEETFTLPGLPPGTYQVEWWDTRSGNVTGKAQVSSRGSDVQLSIPTFARDIACHVTRCPAQN